MRTTINRLSSTFPQGVEVVYPYDTSPFVRLSIEEVVKTLAEAIVLVFLVMFVFLQNLRATIIPTIAVPVVLLGTFGVLSLFGYSVNTLTMFAMVLAIGLLVDDAIVVVENVERVMQEEGLSPKEATRKSMNEITGALIGIATVLSAVFVPMAFFGGSTGIIYRQFSVTIVSAMVLSVLVALVLTPALCATILRPPKDHATQTGPFGWFNRVFDRGTTAYRDGSHGIIDRRWRFLVVFLAIVVAMGWMFARLPSSFLPEEDQGILITSVQLPVGATQDRTERVLAEVTNHYLKRRKGRCCRGLHRLRLRLRRRRAECRYCFRAAEGFQHAQIASHGGAGDRRPRHGRFLQDQGRAGLRTCPARHPGLRQHQRLRLLPAGRQWRRP